MAKRRPVVGITTDISEANNRVKLDVSLAYAQCVARAGGTPVMLAPIIQEIPHQLALCDGFVFTGGDDPRTEAFGVPSHPRITPLHPLRQSYELALLTALETRPQAPVLGICLGMQLMCLNAGGRLNQFMPESVPTHERHWDADHPIAPANASTKLRLPAGVVHSKHKQAIIDTGALVSIASSDDGIIEAAAHPARNFYVGVQWHPERTHSQELGQAIFDQLLAACG
ncbi:MAG: gamma-glutamyl-gamma-aminobutyrate hydrolase family protein [Phycisphaerales bacterium]|nr:gamma-glutamyl-gamma-aminobutyrate hydrolase family protein [Phycisphaerales bacterium]